MDFGLLPALIVADNLARNHLEFIKSRGQDGCSATAGLAEFEERVKDESNIYYTLKTEHFILKSLVFELKKELEKMEEKN